MTTGFSPLISLHLHVKITSCPITSCETFFAGVIIEQIKSNVLSRCFPRCCFIHIAKLFLDKSMNTARTCTSFHDNFVILSSALNVELIVGRSAAVSTFEVLQQCFTKHLGILQNVCTLLIFCGFCFFELLESRHQFLKERVGKVCLLIVN